MAIPDDLKKLTPVKKGDPARLAAASWRINALQNLLRSLIRGDNIVSSPGGNIRKRVIEGVGFTLSTERGGGPSSEEIQRLPLEPFDDSDEDGLAIRIQPGTIAGLLPGSSEDPDPWLLQPLPDTGGALWPIWADIDIAEPYTIGLPTSVSFDIGETMPADSDAVVHLMIGQYQVDGGLDSGTLQVFRNLSGSQALLIVVTGGGGEASGNIAPFWWPV